jgi:hypothetical protein
MLKRNKGVDILPNIAKSKKTKLVQKYIDVKYEYDSTLKKNMESFKKGRLTLDGYLKSQKSAISKAFKDAYALGKEFGIGQTQLDDNERRFIVQQTTKEMQFMSNFANDLQNNSGVMDYTKRIEMYSGSLDSMFGFGRLVYLPEETRIIWTLGVTDKHCLDCLSFAAKNPYTKKTLPGFPKSGASRCLNNCRCFLNYINNNKQLGGEYDHFILDKQFANTGNRKIPSEYDYKYLMDRRDEYYYNRYMFQLTKEDKYKQGYNNSLAEFTEYKSKNNVYFPVYFNVQQSLVDLKEFSNNSKFAFISDYNTLKSGDFTSFFQGNRQIYGKVVEMLGTQARMKTLEGIEYLIDSSSHVLFKEVI